MMLFVLLALVGVLLLVAGGVILTVYLKNKSLAALRPVGASILRWQWVKGLLYWGILSVGTMSECVFIAASLWMTVNSSVHDLVLLLLTEADTVHLSWLATMAFVAVPEFILALALVTTISHIQLCIYNHKDIASYIWAFLYGLPTLSFLVLSVVVISNSMLSTHYVLPDWMIVTRGLSGYMYGFVALLYWQLGTPQEVNRLKEKDDFISGLIAESRSLSDRIGALTLELEQQKKAFDESLTEQNRLVAELQKADSSALDGYSQECLEWLQSGIKTVTVDEISQFTGHSKQKLIKTKFQRSARNKDLILVSSLVEWLKNTPAPAGKISVLPVNGASNEDRNTDNLERLTV
jgi:hypothetical protein